MKSGFKIFWTEHALSELQQTLDYLEENWTERELRIFASKLEHTIEIISKSPEIFPSSIERIEVRKAVVEEHNTLYYRVKNDRIEIVSLFSNLKNPKSKKI